MLSQIYESRTEQNIICLKCEQEKIAVQNSRKQNCLIITYKMEAGKPVKSMAVETQRRKGRSPKQGIETQVSIASNNHSSSVEKEEARSRALKHPLTDTSVSFLYVEKEEARSRALKLMVYFGFNVERIRQKRKKPEVGH